MEALYALDYGSGSDEEVHLPMDNPHGESLLQP